MSRLLKKHRQRFSGCITIHKINVKNTRARVHTCTHTLHTATFNKTMQLHNKSSKKPAVFLSTESEALHYITLHTYDTSVYSHVCALHS